VAQPKTIDFYRCMRPMQDRFVASTRRAAPPSPLLFRSEPRTTAWVLIGASAVLVAVATIVLVTGWGNVSSPLALHRDAMLGVDVLFFSAAAYCFIHATVVLRALEALPYRAGTYIFPACIVDAGGPVLRVWSMADVDAIERLPQPALLFRMQGGERVVVPTAGTAEADRVEAALSSGRAELKRAIAEDDVDMLAELDPLHHTRISSPILSTEGMKPPSPAWARLDWVLALAIGAAMGVGLGAMRNASSDERMYKTVVAAGSIPLYQQYLLRGGRHADEIRDVYLARAELVEAQKPGTLEALQAYVGAHPATKIGPEVDAAVRRVLMIELDKSRAVGTVAALDEFARTYPGSHLDDELKAARHALYAQALAAWKKKARVDAATSAFIERLLASTEKLGAACAVRFQLVPSKTLDDADKRVAKHAYYPGSDALPSHYVTAEAMRPREDSVAQAVADGFAATFPADILAVHPGAPLAPDAQAPAAVPTLVLRYATEYSNALTASAKPRTVFAGIRFDFDGRFGLPEGAPLLVSLKSWRGAELWKIKGGAMALDEFHRKVYDAMIDGAFSEWQRKLLDTFF
jgi:hypothetical protein